MKSNFGLAVEEEESTQSNEEKAFEDLLIKAGAKGSYMVFNEFMQPPKHLGVIDKIAKKELYEKWIKNFTLNIKSKKISIDRLQKTPKTTAIVIGAGPSLEKNKDRLNRTEISNFDIFCTDRALSRLDLMPIEYAVTVDSDEKIKGYYEGVNLADTTAILPITCSPTLNPRVYFQRWYIPSIDPQTDRIMQIMTGLPIIQSYGNVGATACSIAEYLGYKEIILIGMDFAYHVNTLLEQTDWYNKFVEAGATKEQLEEIYKIQINPVSGNGYISDPVFDAYRAAFYTFLNQTKCKVINATEGGSLYHPKLVSMTLEQALTDSPRS